MHLAVSSSGRQKKKENPNTASKIHVIPVTTYSQKKVATADKDNTANVHSTQLLRSPGMTQFPVDNAVKLYPIPPGGTMSVEPISSVPPQIQKQKLHPSTGKKKDQVDQVQFPVQSANTTGHAEAVSPSIDVVTTAKLVATCTAAATAAVLASSDVSYHLMWSHPYHTHTTHHTHRQPIPHVSDISRQQCALIGFSPPCPLTSVPVVRRFVLLFSTAS